MEYPPFSNEDSWPVAENVNTLSLVGWQHFSSDAEQGRRIIEAFYGEEKEEEE